MIIWKLTIQKTLHNTLDMSDVTETAKSNRNTSAGIFNNLTKLGKIQSRYHILKIILSWNEVGGEKKISKKQWKFVMRDLKQRIRIY
jgi:hypothetical protein